MGSVDLKVVLLGAESSGKTSLAERFLHDRYFGRESGCRYQSTIGAAYGEKKMVCQEASFYLKKALFSS